MYSLFMGLWTMLFAKVQYQILILGLDDAGKTTFLEQVKHLYSGSSPPEELKIPPTVGLNIGKLDVARTRFLFWDLGGQSSLRVLWDKYYSDSHAVLWILDATDRARMREAAEALVELAADKDLREAPIILLANKQDDPRAMMAAEVAAEMGLPPDSVVQMAAGPKGALAPSAASIAAAAAVAASPSSASSSNGASSSSSASAASSSNGRSPASASASAAASVPASAYDGHLVRVLPISALTGTGVHRVVELLMEVLPRARRTLQMQDNAKAT